MNRKEIIKKLQETLGPARFKHSLRVEQIAVKLAKKHRVDLAQASVAALLHDCARRYDRPQLLRLAKKLGLVIDPIRRLEPKLFHGKIGAWLAQKEFGLKSRLSLAAIANHTTGRPRMSVLEKIIYLADHIEEGRSFPAAARIRRLACRDMNRAIAASADAKLAYLLKKGLPIFPATIQTRNFYLLKV